MITSFLDSQKSNIFLSDDLETPIGILADFLINCNNGVIEALWVQSGGWTMKLLPTIKIVSWRENQIVIQSEKDLSKPGDDARLSKISQTERNILEASVFEDPSHFYYGHVIDFGFDTLSPRILSIKVQTGSLWWKKQTIIPAHRITRMDHEGIWITPNLIPEEQNLDSTLKKDQLPEMD